MGSGELAHGSILSVLFDHMISLIQRWYYFQPSLLITKCEPAPSCRYIIQSIFIEYLSIIGVKNYYLYSNCHFKLWENCASDSGELNHAALTFNCSSFLFNFTNDLSIILHTFCIRGCQVPVNFFLETLK